MEYEEKGRDKKWRRDDLEQDRMMEQERRNEGRG